MWFLVLEEGEILENSALRIIFRTKMGGRGGRKNIQNKNISNVYSSPNRFVNGTLNKGELD
jgi:hypothetical protein